MKDADLKLMAGFGTLALFVIVLPIRAYVFSLLWLWFMVPLGVPGIGIAHALGFAVMIAMFNIAKTETGKSLAETLFSSLVQSALILGCGWVAHLAM